MKKEQQFPRYETVCPIPVSEKTIVNELVPRIQGYHEDKFFNMKIKVYEQEDILIGVTTRDHVWSMCTKNVMMIDIDLKGPMTREAAYKRVRDYAEYMHERGYDFLFHVYDTDRGVHAFLMNHMIDSLSLQTLHMMVDLCSDDMYTANVRFGGFCVRIGPKVMARPAPGQTVRDLVNSEFIARRASSPNDTVGYGEPLQYNQSVLQLHEEMIHWFTVYYRLYLDTLLLPRYVKEVDRVQSFPPDEFLETVRRKVIRQLKRLDLLKEEAKYKINFHPEKRSLDKSAIRVYSQWNILLWYDPYNYVWIMSVFDMLSVEFEEREGFSKGDALKKIQEWTRAKHARGLDYLFRIYETDTGIHAYLVNRHAPFSEPEALKDLRELADSEKYINFIMTAGFSARVGPRISENGDIEDVRNQYVSKKCLGEVCEIGFGKATNYHENILMIQDMMTSYLVARYRESPGTMMQRRIVNQIFDNAVIPTLRELQDARNYFLRLLVLTRLNNPEQTLSVASPHGLAQGPFAKRYEGLMKDNVLTKCSQKSVLYVMKQMTWIRQMLARECALHDFLLRGPDYPFVFGQDRKTHMIYIAISDLLMIDWDTKDGVSKDSVVELLERFLNSETLVSEFNRVTISDLCFKMYETDNGVHAFCISHRMPSHEPASISLLLKTCSDYVYAGFSAIRGYNIRLSPKVYDSGTQAIKPEETFAPQFVQKAGVAEDDEETNKRVYYVGETENIDPYLEGMVDLIFEFQKYLLTVPNLRQLMLDHDPGFHEIIRDKMIELYNDLPMKDEFEESYTWATSAQLCEGQ